jgi:WD40 repeat protein
MSFCYGRVMSKVGRRGRFTGFGAAVVVSFVVGCSGGGGARPDGGGTGTGGTVGPPLSGAWTACGTLGSLGPRSAALSDDGRILAAVFSDNHLEVVRVSDGSTLLHLAPAYPPDYDGSYVPVALSSDGALVAITEPTVRVLRVADGSVIYNRADGLLLPCFNADATKLAGITPILAAVSIQLADGVEAGPYGDGANRAVSQVSFSPAGAVITMDDAFLVRDETNGTQVSLAGLAGFPNSPRLSPSGRYVATVELTSDGNLVRVYRVSDRALISMHADPAPPFVAEVVFAPDETAILEAGANTTTVLDLATGASLGAPTGALPGSFWAAGPGARPVVAIDSVGILVWNGGDFTGAQPLDVPSAAGTGADLLTSIQAVAVSPDGHRLGVAAGDAVTYWDLTARRQLWARREGADSIAFSPDGTRLLVSRGWVQELPANGAAPAPLPAAKCVPSWSARYTTDGKRIGVSLPWGFLLLTGPDDASFAPILANDQRYPAVAFSPDGLTVATSTPALYRLSDGSRLWPATQDPPPSDVCTPPPVGTPHGTVAFSHDGKLVVAQRGGYDAAGALVEFRTSIYRASDGSLVRDLGTDIGPAPVFSPDDAWLASGPTVMRADGTGTPTTLGNINSTSISTFAPDGTIVVGEPGGLVYLFCPTPQGG